MLKPTILPENVAKELSLAQKSSCKCLGKPFSGQHSLKFISNRAIFDFQASSVSVPEPASAGILLLIGGFGLMRRHRRAV